MIGYLRGHLCEWHEDTKQWHYLDTDEPYDDSRPCPECHILPTKDGHDACISNIKGAAGACCGHGIHIGYINWEGIPAPYGWCRGAWIGIEELKKFEDEKK